MWGRAILHAEDLPERDKPRNDGAPGACPHNQNGNQPRGAGTGLLVGPESVYMLPGVVHHAGGLWGTSSRPCCD